MTTTSLIPGRDRHPDANLTSSSTHSPKRSTVSDHLPAGRVRRLHVHEAPRDMSGASVETARSYMTYASVNGGGLNAPDWPVL